MHSNRHQLHAWNCAPPFHRVHIHSSILRMEWVNALQREHRVHQDWDLSNRLDCTRHRCHSDWNSVCSCRRHEESKNFLCNWPHNQKPYAILFISWYLLISILGVPCLGMSAGKKHCHLKTLGIWKHWYDRFFFDLFTSISVTGCILGQIDSIQTSSAVTSRSWVILDIKLRSYQSVKESFHVKERVVFSLVLIVYMNFEVCKNPETSVFLLCRTTGMASYASIHLVLVLKVGEPICRQIFVQIMVTEEQVSFCSRTSWPFNLMLLSSALLPMWWTSTVAICSAKTFFSDEEWSLNFAYSNPQ